MNPLQNTTFIHLLEKGLYTKLLESINSEILGIESDFPLPGREIIKNNYLERRRSDLEKIDRELKDFENVELEKAGIDWKNLSEESKGLIQKMKNIFRATLFKEQDLLQTFDSEVFNFHSLYTKEGIFNEELLELRMKNVAHMDDYQILDQYAGAKNAIGGNGLRGQFFVKAVNAITEKKKEILENIKKNMRLQKEEIEYLDPAIFSALSPEDQQILFKDTYIEAYCHLQFVIGETVHFKKFASFTSPKSPRILSSNDSKLCEEIEEALNPKKFSSSKAFSTESPPKNAMKGGALSRSVPSITVKQTSTIGSWSEEKDNLTLQEKNSFIRNIAKGSLEDLAKQLEKLEKILYLINEDYMEALIQKEPREITLSSEKIGTARIRRHAGQLLNYRNTIHKIIEVILKEIPDSPKTLVAPKNLN